MNTMKRSQIYQLISSFIEYFKQVKATRIGWVVGACLMVTTTLVFSQEGSKTEITHLNVDEKPNVIVVLTDQLRAQALGSYGNGTVRTPNIDKFASEGYQYNIAISNSPVCVPARSSLLSGQYARTCVGSRRNETQGLFGRENRTKFPDKTIAEAFKEQGYKTIQIGKWHVDCTPSLMGFDESLVVDHIFTDATFSKNEGEIYSVPGFSSDYELKNVKEFIEDHNSEPFFIYYNIVSPHMPLLDVPYKYIKMYDPEQMPIRENVWKNGRLPSNETWFHIYMWQTLYGDQKPITAKATPDFTIQDLTALYYGSVTWVDDIFGEILHSLEENGLKENTIVLFTSDHGEMLGSHHLWNKDRPYEEAIRVPMIYRWPNKIKSEINEEQIASLIDIMPTLLDLSRIEVPESVQGRSLASLMDALSTKTTLPENYAFLETPWGELAIRTPEYMFAVTMDQNDEGINNDRHLFFDLENDIFQLNNKSLEVDKSKVAHKLLEKIKTFDKNTPRLYKQAGYTPWQGSYEEYSGGKDE